MKYVYTGGPWKEFRGYVFAHGNPTEVRDRGTLDALLKHPEFRRVEDAKEEAAAAPAPVLSVDHCQKCGRYVKQGRYMHEKFCRGNRP